MTSTAPAPPKRPAAKRPARASDVPTPNDRTVDRADVARWDGLLSSIGLAPKVREIVDRYLDDALPKRGGVALDAGVGRSSLLARYGRGSRPRRIRELVGTDVLAPEEPLRFLDRFVQADLCRDADAFEPETFDVVLSSFTVEHLADPAAAFRNIFRWLKPGGTLVLSTVNRHHPLVAAYLAVPPALRHRLQRLIKYDDADAYPIVGAANRPGDLRGMLQEAGFVEVKLVTTEHLARAWGRRLPTFALGLVGDAAAHWFPRRRSTIICRARRPAA